MNIVDYIKIGWIEIFIKKKQGGRIFNRKIRWMDINQKKQDG